MGPLVQKLVKPLGQGNESIFLSLVFVQKKSNCKVDGRVYEVEIRGYKVDTVEGRGYT